MQATPQDTGWIEVICGPMFSGKTEELIRRLRRALYARQRVQMFKPKIDTRYDEIAIVSHSRQSLQAEPVSHASDILDKLQSDAEVVAIDEAQFFDRTLIEVVQTLACDRRRVIVAGLDQDFMGDPFEPIPEIMALAEFVTKTLAICVVCGNPAGRSQRLTRQSRRVVVGSNEHYEARCRKCHSTEPSMPAQGPLFPAASAQTAT